MSPARLTLGARHWMAPLRRAVHSQDGRDALLVTGSRLLQNLLGFALSIIIVQRFGLAGAGTLTIASFGVVIQATLLTFGLPFVLAKSTLRMEERNTLGLLAALAGLAIAVPAGLLLGWVFGHDAHEALVIALLSLGGASFAQAATADALLVLQGQTRRVPLSQLGALCGMAAGALFADTYGQFAAALALGRFAGVAAIFSGLRYGWCGWRAVAAHARQGLRFLVPDTAGLVAEQLTTVILAPLATRAELGTFGLCRQFLTAADTPMWSRLVVWYPRLCTAPPATAFELARRMAVQGWLVAIGLALLTPVLALGVYHSPDVAWMAPLLMLCVPLRYVTGTAEMTLRAWGAIGAVNRLVGVRCALVALVPLGLLGARMGGVIAAILLQSVLLAWLARRAAQAAAATQVGRDTRP